MLRMLVVLSVGMVLVGLCGCVSVQTPREVNIGSSRPEPVDSSRVPATSSHEDCRDELRRAYQNLRYLEREHAKLERELDECDAERERYEDELERYQERDD